MIWDGSEEAKKWLKDNFDVTQYQIYDNGDLWIYPLYPPSFICPKGVDISKDEDGEMKVTKEIIEY